MQGKIEDSLVKASKKVGERKSAKANVGNAGNEFSSTVTDTVTHRLITSFFTIGLLFFITILISNKQIFLSNILYINNQSNKS